MFCPANTKAVRAEVFIIKPADYAVVRQTNFIADKGLFVARNPIIFDSYDIENRESAQRIL